MSDAAGRIENRNPKISLGTDVSGFRVKRRGLTFDTLYSSDLI